MDKIIIEENIIWPKPVVYPKGSSVYAVLLEAEDDESYEVVKIGAARAVFARLADYWRAFELEPRLRFVSCAVSDKFKESMQNLLRSYYPNRENDVKWLEYRLEKILLDNYEKIHGERPPGNRKKGSKREYLHHIKLIEAPGFSILRLRPAHNLRKGLLEKLQ